MNRKFLTCLGSTIRPGRSRRAISMSGPIDNLVDFTHLVYLHTKTLAGDPREATLPVKTERTSDGVHLLPHTIRLAAVLAARRDEMAEMAPDRIILASISSIGSTAT